MVTTRVLKSGEYSSATSVYSPETYLNGNPAKYLRPVDHRILGAINSVPRAFAPDRQTVLATARGAAILADILATGRARWADINGPLLSAGPAAAGAFEWRPTEDGRIRPWLTVRTPDPESGGLIHCLKAVPPVYVDIREGRVGPVETGLAAGLAREVMDAPAIAPGESAAVSAAIARRSGALAAAAPPVLAEPIVVSGAPKPILRLTTVELAPVVSGAYGWYGISRPATETLAVGRLGFRYGDVEIAAALKERVPTRIHGMQPIEIHRNVEAERGAARRLQGADLLPLALLRDRVPANAACDFVPEEDGLGWLDFLYGEIDRLRGDGWEVVVEPGFPYDLLDGNGAIEAGIRESSGMDWFEFDLGVMVGSERFDLLGPLIDLIATDGFDLALIEEAGEADQPIYLPLPDGRVMAMPVVRLVPILRHLVELFSAAGHEGDGGTLRLSGLDAALLAALEAGAGDAGLAWRGGERIRALGAALRDHGGIPDVVLPPWFAATLRPYQARGVAWLAFLREAGIGGILADDMGLGKTVQALALIALEKAAGRLNAPALVIAPTSLMANWRREAAAFAPDLRVLTLHGSDRMDHVDAIAESDLVLTTYPLVARDHEVLSARPWHMIVLDEAQTIKNPNAATTRLIRRLEAPHRFCLTGTPMENHLGELWSLFDFVAPGFLGDASSFNKAWRTPIEKKGDVGRGRLLAARVKPFLLRRTKAEVAAELPPKTVMTERVDLGGGQRELYEAIRLSMHDKVRSVIAEKGFSRSRIVILDALLKLRQACCDPRLVKRPGKPVKATSAKLERLMEMVGELAAEGRKIIVFSQFTSMLDLIRPRLEAAGIAYALLTGQTKMREAEITAFQEGTVPVFLISLKAGGTGLNLTAADTVILYDPWWNPAVEEQAIDRAHRIGQDRPVFVHKLIAGGTIEEKMEVLKDKKRKLAESLFDHDGNPTLAMTEADIDMLLSAD